MIFWELIGNPSQNQWDFLTIDGDTPLAGMYGIPTCRNILRITLHEEISPISGESRPLLVWDAALMDIEMALTRVVMENLSAPLLGNI